MKLTISPHNKKDRFNHEEKFSFIFKHFVCMFFVCVCCYYERNHIYDVHAHFSTVLQNHSLDNIKKCEVLEIGTKNNKK